MTETSNDLPFQPIRSSLYSSRELMEGFIPNDGQSLANTPDFRSFVYFVKNGRAAPTDPYAGMMQALHDNSILRAMYAYLNKAGRPAAAIMGGHREERGSKTYLEVALLAKRLTETGFLMASGGGPGCMEATHLGALLAGRSEADLNGAVEKLKQQPKLPSSYDIVAPDGTVNQARVGEIHRWAVPAFEVLKEFEETGGTSLAVPTWHYGHEPISPLATHVAKYFLNSIREDVLLALATNGIIFSPGRAGTLQEVFQDAAQNYYASGSDPFAPMIFWDKKFWTEQLPVGPVLEALFIKLKSTPPTEAERRHEYERKVLFTSDIDEAIEFLVAARPSTFEALSRLGTLGLKGMAGITAE